MDERRAVIPALECFGHRWRLEGHNFVVTLHPSSGPPLRWHLAIECGDLIDQVNDDGQLIARRRISRYVVGSSPADVISELNVLEPSDRLAVVELLTALILRQLMIDLAASQPTVTPHSHRNQRKEPAMLTIQTCDTDLFELVDALVAAVDLDRGEEIDRLREALEPFSAVHLFNDELRLNGASSNEDQPCGFEVCCNDELTNVDAEAERRVAA